MLWIFVVVVLLGVIATLALAWAKQREKVGSRLVVILAGTVIAIPIGYFSGPIALGLAQTGAVSGYQQFLNGTVEAANVQVDQCSEDGPCVHTYDCDSYQEETSTAYTDTNGNYHPAQYETEYHQCPVATMEYTYTITALAWHTYTYTLVDHGFAAHPRAWCCTSDPDGDQSIPPNVPRGVPSQWLKAKHDLAAGNSDPVTVQDGYANYILANEATIFRTYSDAISMLHRRHLMPPGPLAPIYDSYLASKVDFVGLTVPAGERVAWQSAIAHLNAALGTNLEGDMHVVAINANALQGVITPQSYAAAIQADWLNNYGKNAMAKNAIILVLGVNPTTNTIAWAQANTGMPIGNAGMFQALREKLPGVTFTPQAVFGTTRAKVVSTPKQYLVHYTIGSGIAAQIVMKQHPFLRACMNCTSARDKRVDASQQGFVYLKTELPLPTWGVVVTIIVDLVILAILWGIMLWIDSNTRSYNTPTRPYDYDRSSFR